MFELLMFVGKNETEIDRSVLEEHFIEIQYLFFLKCHQLVSIYNENLIIVTHICNKSDNFT